MSKSVHIISTAQFEALLKSSKIVVADFYADWCGPCKQIAPIYEQLSAKYSSSAFTFAKVDVDAQPDISRMCGITAMPTFLIFRDGAPVQTIRGADPRGLSMAVSALAADPDGEPAGSASAPAAANLKPPAWIGAPIPRGYGDITEHVNPRGLEMLNADSSFGDARTLFAPAGPAGLTKGKAAVAATADAKDDAKPDWVESDTDEQLMLFMPFRSVVKVHSLHITSLAAASSGADSAMSETPLRPRTIQLYTNHTHVLGFDEAENVSATQSVVLAPSDWSDSTATAVVELRFVKFQNLSSLVLFVVDGEGDGERVRIDRVRVIGESGEKLEMGKLEKVNDED